MALSKDLEEELTCPIDLEFFVEPMLLKCLHLLCEKDVNHMMDEDELIQCPVCKRVSEKRDIKKDFRAKRLIKLLQCDKDKHKKQLLCECDQELAICLCRECNMYFGKGCQKVHIRIPTTKNHHLDPLDRIIEERKEHIQSYLIQIKSKASEYEQTKDKWEKAKEKTKTYPLYAKIQESEDAIIKETKRVHYELRQQLQTELDKGTADMDEIISNMGSKINLLNRKMHILKEILDSDDKKTLLNTEIINEIVDPTLATPDKTAEGNFPASAPEMPEITLSNQDQILKELRQLKLVKDKTSVEPRHSSKCDPDRGSGAIIKRRNDECQTETESASANDTSVPSQATDVAMQGQILPQMGLTDVLNKTLHANVVNQFDEQVRSISFIKNEIWIILDSGDIDIFEEISKTSVRKVNSLTILYKADGRGNNSFTAYLFGRKETNLLACSVIYTDDGTIIAACGGYHAPQKLGLVAVNRDGLVQNIISYGQYLDVSHDNDCIFGLRKDSVITVHTQQNKGWCEMRSISIETGITRFSVVESTLIMSNFKQSTVSLYNLISNTQRQVTGKGKDVFEAGYPRVCCKDKGGNVLICDMDNHKLLVLLLDNTWKFLTVAETLKYPFDAAVGKDGRLYVINDSRKSLSIVY